MQNKLRFASIIILTLTSLVACERSLPATDGNAAQNDISSIFTMAETLTAQAPAPVDDSDTSATPDGTEVTANADVTDGVEATNDPLDPFAPTSTATSAPLVVTAAATESAAAAPTDPVNAPNTYTLQKQEYPYCIARRFDVDINALLAASGLNASSLYFEGQLLTITQGGASFAGERMLISHPTQYTVQSGDSLYWIACKFGDVYPESIAQANGIDIDATLNVGQVLQIP